jgi:hypothetical protein
VEAPWHLGCLIRRSGDPAIRRVACGCASLLFFLVMSGRPAFAADLAVEIFLFDQDDAVLTDDGECEVCNPCAFTVPDGAHVFCVSIADLMFRAGGTWPEGLTGVQALVYVDEVSAHVSLRPIPGADPALDISATWQGATLPSSHTFGSTQLYAPAELTTRTLTASTGAELVVVPPWVM